MFKNLSLGAKIFSGFFILIILAAIVGGSSWLGLSGVTTKVALVAAGGDCISKMNTCATLRRDFDLKGFTKVEGETKDTKEKWDDAYAEFSAELRGLENAQGMPAAGKELVAQAIESGAGYKAAFDRGAQARVSRDEAFADWSRLGWGMTEEIGKAKSEVILPAMEKAKAAGDLANYVEWTNVLARMEEDVIESFLLLRVYAIYLMTTNADKQWEDFQQQYEKVTGSTAEWTKLVGSKPELKGASENITNNLKAYGDAGLKYHDGLLVTRQSDAELVTTASAVVARMNDLATLLNDEKDALIARTTIIVTFATLAGAVLGILLAILITRSITKPINGVIASLEEGGRQVEAASAQVAQSSQSMAEGASEQASSLEETSASLEQLSSMTKQNADNANLANNMTSETRNAANEGQGAMKRLISAIDEIKSSSDETARIIKTIDEIAFQTNLLALNAAVEAARAGEAGKGFAVVAEEVRNLAQRSAEAARNTSELIEQAQRNSDNGVQVSGEVAGILENIVERIEKVAQLVNEVTAASREQSQGIDQINTAVAQMDQVTQANAASSEEAASASEELSAQSKELGEMVNTLVRVVSGQNAGRRTTQSSARPPQTLRRPPKAQLAHRPKPPMKKQIATQRDVVVRPQEVIPLDDDEDLGEF